MRVLDRTAATWRRVLPASCVLAAVLVAGFVSRSGASTESRSAPPSQGTSGARAPGAPPAAAGPSQVALEPLDIRQTPNPLRGLSPSELARAALTKPASLGSVCLGRPNRGHLW